MLNMSLSLTGKILIELITIGQQINPKLNFLMFKNNFLS